MSAKSEATAVTRTFQAAMAAHGASATAAALKHWYAVPESTDAAVVAEWMRGLVSFLMQRREVTRQLALSYYRLMRALMTGRTIADPSKPASRSYTSLAHLRAEFAALAEGRQPPPPPATINPSDRIPADKVSTLDAFSRARSRQDQEEIVRGLFRTGPKSLSDAKSKIGDSDRAEAKLKEAHDTAAARMSASAARQAMNGGRDAVTDLIDADKSAMGWVRISRTGTPCAFCAMLISREATYKSGGSATMRSSDGGKFHDNCKCVAIPVWNKSEYDNREIYELNRLYSKWWPQVTEGLSGADARRAWRRFIDSHNKQAVRATNQVQAA